MKLGPVTKLDNRNKTSSKKFVDDAISENCDVIVIFRIFGQFRAVRRPDSGHRVCKSYVSVTVTFPLTKNENRNRKSLTQLSHYCFEQRYFFGQKTLLFCRKMLTSAKMLGPRH